MSRLGFLVLGMVLGAASLVPSASYAQPIRAQPIKGVEKSVGPGGAVEYTQKTAPATGNPGTASAPSPSGRSAADARATSSGADGAPPHAQGRVGVSASVLPCFADGVLKAPKKGTVFGVNYFDGFYRFLRRGRDFSYRKGLESLRHSGIPFIRFSLTGFWPDDLQVPMGSPDVFLARFDQFVADARAQGIYLIPSVFWNYASLPDYVGEPLSAWGQHDSRTRQAMRQFVSMLASRYADETMIVGWEFGNEFNSYLDWSGSAKKYKVDVGRGTPATRGDDSEIRSADLRAALKEFADIVAPSRRGMFVSSGFDMPRNAAARLRKNALGLDSPEEFVAVLVDQNVDPVNTISVHLYPYTVDRFKYRGATLNGLVSSLYAAGAQSNKIPFIGEFGVHNTEPALERQVFLQFVQAIAARDGGFAALWVYDFSYQDKYMNVTPDGPRAYQLREISSANRFVDCR
jgi:hypothetical protein